ncbi:hypothetical protein Tco_0080918 [Tanacetum coccineum]
MANLPNNNEFPLAAEAAPDNMNGWVEEEDPEMEEEEDVRADNKRLKMMLDCSENCTRDAWREHDQATWHYHHLRSWSIMVKNLLPPRLQYQEPPYALPETLLAPVTHNDPRDPYVAARDAATAPATDTDDAPTQKETSPPEPQGSPPHDS